MTFRVNYLWFASCQKIFTTLQLYTSYSNSRPRPVQLVRCDDNDDDDDYTGVHSSEVKLSSMRQASFAGMPVSSVGLWPPLSSSKSPALARSSNYSKIKPNSSSSRIPLLGDRVIAKDNVNVAQRSVRTRYIHAVFNSFVITILYYAQ